MGIGWTAVTNEPTSGTDDLKLEILGDGRVGKRVRANIEATKQSLGPLIETFNNPVNITVSGYVAHKDDILPDQIHVDIVEA